MGQISENVCTLEVIKHVGIRPDARGKKARARCTSVFSRAREIANSSWRPSRSPRQSRSRKSERFWDRLRADAVAKEWCSCLRNYCFCLIIVLHVLWCIGVLRCAVDECALIKAVLKQK